MPFLLSKIMKRYITILYLLIIPLLSYAANAVEWSYRLIGDNTDSPSIEMTANIEPGFHLYAVENPEGGSNPLVFYFDTKGCKLVGKPVANKPYHQDYDDVFEMVQFTYDGTVVFTQKLKPEDKEFSVDVEIKGQACNDMGCVQVFGSHSFVGKALLHHLKKPKL